MDGASVRKETSISTREHTSAVVAICCDRTHSSLHAGKTAGVVEGTRGFRSNRTGSTAFRLYFLTAVVIAALFGIGATAAAQNFSIGFPITGQNPYTAPIITVLDHSTDYFYNPYHHSVVAYTGEIGKDRCSPSGKLNGTPPCGYYNGAYSSSNPVQFLANGNYVGTSADSPYAQNVLNYRGHPGYDYAFGQGTIVVAAADGDLYVPAFDTVNNPSGNDPYCYFHTFYIRHGNGWTTWYLHTAQIMVGSFSSSPHAQCADGLKSSTYPTSDTFVAHVSKGEPIATVGNFADGYAGGVGYSLWYMG